MAVFTFSPRTGVDKNPLVDLIVDITQNAKDKIQKINDLSSTASIGDMFDLQMIMNRLSQISEMSSSVISASNSAIMSMARNVKG